MSLNSNDRAILSARVKVGRMGAVRMGYTPKDVDTKVAGAVGAERFYVHHEREDDERIYPIHTVVAP